ncbi:MAG: cytochrome c oxidase subunit II [Gemmatimonadaceae bacterium]
MPIEQVVAALTSPLLRSQGFMYPAGQPATDQAKLGWALTVVASLVVIIISALLLVAVFRKRNGTTPVGQRTVDDARDDVMPTRQQATGMSAIYVGVAITTVVLVATFASTVAALVRTNRGVGAAAITIHVIAHQWWWEARYDDGNPSHNFVTANELHIPVGSVVRLTLESPDVIHSFWIPELAGKTDAIPGQQNVAWFQATRTGEFRGQCAEYCGLQHAHMASVVFADSASIYEQWAMAQRHLANTPTDSTARIGQQVFLRSCGACHAVRGTDALGVLGPDLTHLASRNSIGAGVRPNTTENLRAWIRDAQAIKPGVQMPPMILPSGDMSAVVHYLESLR